MSTEKDWGDYLVVHLLLGGGGGERGGGAPFSGDPYLTILEE